MQDAAHRALVALVCVIVACCTVYAPAAEDTTAAKAAYPESETGSRSAPRESAPPPAPVYHGTSSYGSTSTSSSPGPAPAEEDGITSDCKYKGIKLAGKVKFVDAFPDLEVKVVSAFPDLKVKMVEAFPDDCGEWKTVDAFPDFTVKIVDAFPDIQIKYVDAFPGLP